MYHYQKSGVINIGHADDVAGANVELQQPAADVENDAGSDFFRRHRRGARQLVDGDKNWTTGQ